MRFDDEWYVRLYVRDTVTWNLWPWQARCVLPLLIRKVDRAGCLDCGGHAPAKAVAATINIPLEVVEVGLAAILDEQTAVVRDGVLIVTNYIKAQTTPMSDRARKALSRETARLVALGHLVTERDEPSQNVTEGHAPSAPVTNGHSEKSREEKRLDTSETSSPRAADGADAPAAEPTKTRKARRQKPAQAEDAVPDVNGPAWDLYAYLLGNETFERLAPIDRPGDLAVALSDPDLYPGVNLVAAAKEAALWLTNHPDRRKSNGARFLSGWMRRAQDSSRGRPVQHADPPPGLRYTGGRKLKEGWKAGGPVGKPEEFRKPLEQALAERGLAT